jgi:hypothetical protein
MKRLFLIIIVGCIVLSCKQSISSKKAELPNIGTLKDSKTLTNFSGKKLIEGVWGFNQGGNAMFRINSDSLFYMENQDILIPYRLKGYTLIIENKVPVRCIILKLTIDSLWFIDEFSEDTTKLCRF